MRYRSLIAVSAFTAVALVAAVLGYRVLWPPLDPNDGAAPHAQAQRPNILLVVIDDLGFTDLGSYGSEIKTPHLDGLAQQGLRFANFYVSPNCSTTRSMLMSGMDHHLSGNGTMLEHIADNQRGLPGYEGHLSFRVAALPEVLQDAGYKTYMTGKWHLGDSRETSPAARGFDRSYSLLHGGASHFADKKGLAGKRSDAGYREDGELIDSLPEGFYSTSFYTDKLIEYIEDDRSDDDSPFFAYLSYSAVHWPLQVPDNALDLYKGQYRNGYDKLRQQRYRNAMAAGVIRSHTRPHAGSAKVPAWNRLNSEQKKIQERKMEIYAAMLELVDRNVGRLLKYLQDTDKLQNTLIIVMSDNGAEGNRRFRLGGDDWVEKHFDHSYEQMGREGSYVFYGPGWAQAGSAPFRLWKAHTAEGGIHAPLILAGPGVAHRGQVIHAPATVRDLMPTILEATRTPLPQKHYRNREVLPITGRSMTKVLNGERESIHAPDEFFGWELFGGRAIRKGDWKLLWVAGQNGEDRWELFNLANDPGETSDLSLSEPEKLEEMLVAWEAYVSDSNVTLPLGDLRQPWGDEY